ncbi:hypothetical protein CWL40_004426, partial [Vibrio parahaemolyticus]|nr:hypothetical protein [Vibrio parahaemolyticus]
KKTIRWLSVRVARELSQQLGIPQKLLKPRLLVRTVGKGIDKAFILWMGSSPMAAERVGRSRQNRKGATAGRHRFEGAFVSQYSSSSLEVRIRQQRNESAGHFPLNDKVTKGDDKHRYPIIRIGIEIDAVAREIFRRLDRRALDRFKTVIEQELNYVVNHESKKARK